MNSVKLEIRGLGKGYVYNRDQVGQPTPRTQDERRTVAESTVWHLDGLLCFQPRQVMGGIKAAICLCQMKLNGSAKRGTDFLKNAKLDPELWPMMWEGRRLTLEDVVYEDTLIYNQKTGKRTEKVQAIVKRWASSGEIIFPGRIELNYFLEAVDNAGMYCGAGGSRNRDFGRYERVA